MTHYDHQRAAGRPAVAFLQPARTLDVEVADGRRVIVPIGAAVVRRADLGIEVHPEK